MSKEAGALKYFVGVLLTPTGIASMYIFGDGIFNTIAHFEAVIAALTADTLDALIMGLIEIYVPMPGELIGSLVLYPVIGGGVAALFWYIAVK
jgi:hypothetical protein